MPAQAPVVVPVDPSVAAQLAAQAQTPAPVAPTGTVVPDGTGTAAQATAQQAASQVAGIDPAAVGASTTDGAGATPTPQDPAAPTAPAVAGSGTAPSTPAAGSPAPTGGAWSQALATAQAPADGQPAETAQPVVQNAPAAAAAAASAGAGQTGRAADRGTQPVAAASTAPAGAVPVAAPTAAAPTTATVAAAPAAPATPATPLTEQLGAHLRALTGAKAGTHVLTVALDPVNLGDVKVIAHISADTVRLDLVGSTDAGRAALRGALEDLRRDLSDAGIAAELDLGGSSAGSSAPDQSGDGREAARGTGLTSDGPLTDGGRPAAAITPVAPASSVRGLDLVV
ncbi:MAG: flagellar hook-length control protein FliK [Cellulomonas sp.]|nr:flagellar hook-length control protein FliK [Cellulomonas sp.]